MERFTRPTDIINKQDTFSGSEVGLNHPTQPIAIRLRDTGDIEIFAGEGLAIVLNKASRTITFLADKIKFQTKGDDGLTWNRLGFNHKATTFNEPAFLPVDDSETFNMYKGANDYMMGSQ